MQIYYNLKELERLDFNNELNMDILRGILNAKKEQVFEHCLDHEGINVVRSFGESFVEKAKQNSLETIYARRQTSSLFEEFFGNTNSFQYSVLENVDCIENANVKNAILNAIDNGNRETALAIKIFCLTRSQKIPTVAELIDTIKNIGSNKANYYLLAHIEVHFVDKALQGKSMNEWAKEQLKELGLERIHSYYEGMLDSSLSPLSFYKDFFSSFRKNMLVGMKESLENSLDFYKVHGIFNECELNNQKELTELKALVEKLLEEEVNE